MTTSAHQPCVLVVNSGSSSIKYQLVSPVDGERIASGIVERIGEDASTVSHTSAAGTTTREGAIADHEAGLRTVLDLFAEVGPDLAAVDVVAVGHRVVQGGAEFGGPVLVDDDVVATIEALSPLAPLHNPANLAGITVARELLPDVPHVVVFDTAFFRDLPAEAATYAIDRGVAAEHQVRRYGAHGTSHQYVAQRVAEVVGRPVEELNTIVLHLGNGASVSAVRGGAAVDTSMGLTPLEGLVMGTRSGDIDPAVVFHLVRNAGMSVDDVDDLLNRRSGLKGLTGQNDLREVHRLVDEGDEDARTGLAVYVHRLKKYVGAYTAVLGRVDVIAFTAGVGENDDVVRAQALAGLEPLGVVVDAARNAGRKKEATVISADSSRTTVLVVPTNEELAIARQAMEVVGRGADEDDEAPAAVGHA
ncbi:acetate/propionate family kinase [Cellulomonas massiliensis]|uniref:acetate/propionate family kinase n=1 Tax=Cellulomonas massiliensis TaxID=1465811 RepID=UPI0003004FC1|nr:acetate kinase [Cellulomonas massiliensis]